VAIAINGSTRNQVRVNNTPIVSLGPEGGERAKIIARRLQNLASRQKLAPAIAEPQQVNGLPVGSVGDRVVFTVDPDTADWYGRRPEDLTVMWVNNLRIALGGQPLPERKALNYQYNFRPPAFDLQGLASWYGPYFYGRPTASGEIYRPGTMTAAHKTLPLGTYLRVTAPSTGRSIVVRINDRGPYVGPRILDLSETAAQQLGVWEVGVAPVQIDILESPTFEE
jgi:rare lipoprotein A